MIPADEIETGEIDTRGVVRCMGLSSGVIDAGDDHLGHILMADYDGDYPPLDMRDETANEPGVNALFESSSGSFHYYNLSVRDLDQQLLRALRLHGDADHVAASARRGYFVLRISPKIRDDDETTYKPRPTLRSVWFGGETEYPQSLAHFRWIETMAQEDGVDLPDEYPDQLEWIGQRVVTSMYLSVDDEIKRSISDADQGGR